MKKAIVVIAIYLGSVGFAHSAEYRFSPTDLMSDIISTIENALPGDTITLNPGTYTFTVVMTNSGAPGNPITIRGSSEANRPVIDLDTFGTFYNTSLPATHHSSSNRWTTGVFVVYGAGYIDFEDLVIQDAHHSGGHCRGGFQIIADGGPVNVTRCKVTGCDVGFANGNATDIFPEPSGDDLVTVMSCEFTGNGRHISLAASGPPGHNVYTAGGSLVMQFCKIGASTEGQNLHLRSKNALIRYCYIFEPYSYMADMAEDRYEQLNTTFEQVHTYIGNIFVDGKPPQDPSAGHCIVVMEGGILGGSRTQPHSQTLNLYYNTWVGVSSVPPRLGERCWTRISRVGSTKTHNPTIRAYNNVIWHPTPPFQPYDIEYGPEDVGTITVDMRYN